MPMTTSVSPISEPNPQLIWDTFQGYVRTSALRAAIDLDLFTAVAEGATTAEGLAKRCDASTRGTRILCDYLTVIGLLLKAGDSYSLTPTSAAFLNRHSPACMASMVYFLNSPKVMAGFTNFREAVRRGGTVLSQGGVTEAELDEWVTFAENMTPIIRFAAEFMAEEAVRTGASPRRVLDIAAGHGMFGIAVARRAPEAEITAQDWPNVLKVAERNARSAGVADRFRWKSGDAFAVPFEDGYDLVLLTNFLHHFDEPTCVTLLRKIYACLNPGGRLLTLEFIPNEDRVTPPIAASFSILMLGLTPAGDAYTMKQLEAMLRQAGFNQNEMKEVPQSPQQLIVSTK
jgi:ubiquinone/menaquinone biosynthesis C-methylase UbiE